MRCTWMFTGDDGRSHFADLDVPLLPRSRGSQSDPVDTKSATFREIPADGTAELHTAPRRQFVVTLGGVAEVECGDGSKRRFGPGDILLADDTTGEGHYTRQVEGTWRSLIVALSPDVDPATWRV